MLEPPPRSIAHESLGFTRWARLGFVFVGIAIASAILSRISIQGQRGMLTMFAIEGVAIYVFAVVPSALRRRMRLSRLASLDLPIDRASYLKALDSAALRARFAIEVQTRSFVDTAELKLPAGTTVSPAPTSFTVTSPVTSTSRNGGGWTYYYNGSLHDWFMDVSEQLLPLHRRLPFTTMTVRFVPEGASR